jgi:hypothetical protein
MDRRTFIKTSAAGITSLAAGNALAMSAFKGTKLAPDNSYAIRNHKKPVAIAMWDFSWLLRHYGTHKIGSEFADWDKVLDELVARGYNAIRLDVFPHMVASTVDGKIENSFKFGGRKRPVMWGAQHDTFIDPRQGLLEFMPKCIDRNIKLGLSTWFFGGRNDEVIGEDGFVRVWDETLTFMKDNDLLHNIYYVDLLNEYPLFHGFSWLKKHLDEKAVAQAEGVHEFQQKAGDYNDPVSRKKYIGFVNRVIERLQKKWPDIDFIFSVTNNGAAHWRAMADSKIAALDVHYWFIMNGLLNNPDTGYWQNVHSLAPTDEPFAEVNRKLKENWLTHKDKLTQWLDKEMADVASLGKKYNKPIGNTEGWGTVNWLDHPDMDWDIIKEAGLIGAKLGRKHGYSFNCSSNFTHPQFPGLWNDVQWHKKVTSIIRNG